MELLRWFWTKRHQARYHALTVKACLDKMTSAEVVQLARLRAWRERCVYPMTLRDRWREYQQRRYVERLLKQLDEMKPPEGTTP